MRHWWPVLVLLLAGLFAAAPASADVAGTERTDDGYGVRLGAADAPAQLEIFCEPQCPDCAKFEAASNDQLVQGLASHRLAVTYRWLTFLDERRHSDVSARLANALMVAADPATPSVAYQNFVGELYRRQGSIDDVAAIARESGLPGPVVDRIAAGEPGLNNTDITAMDDDNHRRLSQADPQSPGTPTVYDLRSRTVVDTEDPGWLDRLMQAG